MKWITTIIRIIMTGLTTKWIVIPKQTVPIMVETEEMEEMEEMDVMVEMDA
jgi:hypothetical protein